MVVEFRARLTGVHAKCSKLECVLAYFVLLFGRAKVPDLFLHGHETFFLTPLVCLVSGGVLGALWARGGARRAFAALVLSVLTVQGLYPQWRSITDPVLP